MASGNTWADQWDTSNDDQHNSNYTQNNGKPKDNGKMAKAKVVAVSGLEKAKVVAAVGAQKLKVGTSASIKWIKTQYRKRTSK